MKTLNGEFISVHVPAALLPLVRPGDEWTAPMEVGTSSLGLALAQWAAPYVGDSSDPAAFCIASVMPSAHATLATLYPSLLGTSRGAARVAAVPG